MSTISYDNKKFRSTESTGSGEVSGETIFHYHQTGNIVWAEYSGGEIVRGHLLATRDAQGGLDMRYHHINARGEIMTGRCRSSPEILAGGRLRLHENWQWTSGDHSTGSSVLEEI